MVAELNREVRAAIEELRSRMMGIEATYGQKLKEIEQNFVSLNITIDAQLRGTQKKIQGDQTSVIDHAAKKMQRCR